MKKKKIILAGVIGIVVLLIGFSIWRGASHKNAGTFQLAEVVRGDIENSVSSTGTLSAVGTVEIGAQVSGTIESVTVDFNDVVGKGQVLAKLETDLFEAQVIEAEANLMSARAKAKQAQVEFDQNEPLFEEGYISESEFVVTEAALQSTLASLKSAEAALARAKTNLEYTTIRSPIEGTVIERSIEAGQTIAASFQTPTLFTIAEDLSMMQIDVNVDESDIGLIEEGQTVRFTVQAYPDDEFDGIVRQVRLQPTTIQNVVNYTVVVDAENDRGMLLPGMTATVDFLIEQRHDVLVVPNAALQFTPDPELMRRYGYEPRGHMGTMAEAQEMPDEAPYSDASATSALSRVFVLDEEGLLCVAFFEAGATDGVYTEVKDRTTLRIHMMVVTGYGTNGGSEKTATQNRVMFPGGPPPRGGPPPGM